MIGAISEAAGVDGVAVTAPDTGGQRRAAARLPHHAGVPDQPVGIERELARGRFVGDEAAARIAHRHAIGVDHRIALADLDVLVTDTAEQRDRRADRHRHIGAGVFALVALVELARVLALVTARHLPAERQVARPRADAGPRDMVGRAVKNILRLRTRRKDRGLVDIDLGIAEAIARPDVEPADAAREGRPCVE